VNPFSRFRHTFDDDLDQLYGELDRNLVLQDDIQHFIQEISALRSLTEVAGITGLLLEKLEVFEHEVEHKDSNVWERKEARNLRRNELVQLSLAVLRAYGS
jgi:hypothetical protein